MAANDELYEERAAIMEYLGNQTREEAERNARKDIDSILTKLRDI